MEERLNKLLYKIELYLIKIIPPMISLIFILNIVLSYFNIEAEILSMIGGMSALETGAVKAFTLSIFTKRTSVVGFNKHKNKYDYINSVVHEAEHVKQDVLRYYKVKDEGEPPAYTIGYIVVRMIAMLKYIL